MCHPAPRVSKPDSAGAQDVSAVNQIDSADSLHAAVQKPNRDRVRPKKSNLQTLATSLHRSIGTGVERKGLVLCSLQQGSFTVVALATSVLSVYKSEAIICVHTAHQLFADNIE